MKTTLKAMFLFCMLLGLSSLSLASTITFDPTGNGGVSESYQIGSWDWAQTSIATVFSRDIANGLSVGQVFQVYTQSRISAFKDEFNEDVFPSNLSSMEVTAVIGFQEVVTSIDASGTAHFSVVAGGNNFFYMYTGSRNADFSLSGATPGVAGTGFADGTQIAYGTVDVGTGTFGLSQVTPVVLDQYNGDQATAAAGFNTTLGQQLSVKGEGGGQLNITVDDIDFNSNYFPDLEPDWSFILTFTTQQNLPFTTTDPMNRYTIDGTVAGVKTLADLGIIGPVNGASGTLLLFEGDASQTQSQIPEPGTMLLFGSGLLSIGIIGYRRRTRN